MNNCAFIDDPADGPCGAPVTNRLRGHGRPSPYCDKHHDDCYQLVVKDHNLSKDKPVVAKPSRKNGVRGFWTPERDDLVSELWADHTSPDIATQIGDNCTAAQVRVRARALNLPLKRDIAA